MHIVLARGLLPKESIVAHLSKNIVRFRLLISVGVTILVLGVLGYKWLGPQPPEAVRDRAIAALERRDSQSLCELADPDEANRLHLTRTAVAGVLNETLWNEAPLKNSRVEKVTQTPDDQSLWEVHWANEKPGSLRLIVPVIDDLKKGWRLNLSDMLYGACWRTEGGKQGMKKYSELARKYGIEGVRSQSGGYKSMETLATQIKGIFGD